MRSYLITTLLLSPLMLFGASDASATWNYNHCGSGGQDNSQGSVCNSSLGEYTYDLMTKGIDPGTSPSENNGVQVKGTYIQVSAWSDTSGGWSEHNGQWVYNDKVTQDGDFHRYSGSYGYGYGLNNNQDNYYRYDHAIDNHKLYAEGSRGHHYDATDFDFILFSFDQDVVLNGASFGWADEKYESQVSVAALSDISILSSGTANWANVVENALSAGSFNITYCDPGFTSAFNFSSSAKYWLVGAYNSAFGDIGGSMYNDAFKLASVGFTTNGSESPPPSTEVSEPTALGLLMAGGLFIGWRKIKDKKRAA